MIVQSLITVKLESPDGAAVFKIRRPRKNIYYQFTTALRTQDAPAKAQAYDDFVKAMCANVIEVENLSLEDGNRITPADFKSLEVDSLLVDQLATGYIAALAQLAGGDSLEKKDSSSELNSD